MASIRLMAALACTWLAAWAALPALAQSSSFSPAIMVNEDAITFYEIDQRQRLLDLFNTPGDLARLAREQLIEERLKDQEMRRAGLGISEEALAQQLEEFAGRANVSYAEFLGRLASAGIAEETLRDFVRVGVSWRDYIRARYTPRSAVNARDIDLEIANIGGGGSRLEVLLNEIIIPAPPERAGEVRAIAERISRMRSIPEFQAAARQYSALRSREEGGALDWTPLENFPAPVRGLFLGLAPGEVTRPLEIPNAVALFQLRGVREVPQAPSEPALIDYAVLALPGAASGAALAEGRRLAARVDTCDDLYGNVSPASVQRAETAPGQIPGDIGLRLASLDPGEISLDLVRGDSLLLVMLCGRTPRTEAEIDRTAIETQLRSQRLSGFSDQLVARLRSQASIRRFE